MKTTREICGATSKGTGKPCPLSPAHGRSRCKWHGGASTGPKTEHGKEMARINGCKGGRPRKNGPHPCAAKPNPMDAPVGRCGDCANLSAAYTCMPAARGELGPEAALRPDMRQVRRCKGFVELVRESGMY